MTAEWFDSHCHLYELDDAGDAIVRARHHSVTGMMVLGVDPATSERARALTEHEGVYSAAAFHPTSTEGWEDDWAAAIDVLLEDPSVVAVGESGLDLYWDKSYLDSQIAAFEAHIGLAKKHAKPLVIHTRDSVDEAIAVLSRVGPPPRLVFHCWSGDEVQLGRVLDLGSHVSFAGNVTFKKNEHLRDRAREVPVERLLVETDSPYLTPEPHRGKRNEPSNVAHVGAAVAAARGVPVEAIADATRATALDLFGIDP